ncbi:putative Late nodulin [Medicago truncatula]|uniref:Nodule Cysteine-Rich (NCR) secreted peptide n=1 Tax=Medicago truncatula TaxID=3880 RepID=G7JM79_MEDTR|nr:Nodule Cysteine-Rich (NCR) secreted peptide [Medicago truncatula]RHN60625.1 putative Late nodulin [Medicago truncatula]
MAKILMFVYALIIFISLVITGRSTINVMCYYDHDCPFVLDHIAECKGGVCEYTAFFYE